MSVHLVTLHTYRSWTEDNPRGYIQRGTPGIQPSNKRLADHRARLAKHDPVRFKRSQYSLVLDGVRDICERREWRPHAIAVTPTHIHVLVSWRGNVNVRSCATKLKQLLGMMLSKQKGTRGNRWFSRGWDDTPVRDRAHFDHLVTDYLPKHVKQNGEFWREEKT